MANCNLNGILDCWSRVKADPTFQPRFATSPGLFSISLLKGLNKLGQNFYSTRTLTKGQIPSLRENPNIRLIHNVKNGIQNDYGCNRQANNYDCSRTSSSFIFYARLLVNYESFRYPVIGVNLAKTLCASVTFSSVAFIHNVSESTSYTIVKHHVISLTGSCSTTASTSTTTTSTTASTSTTTTSTTASSSTTSLLNLSTLNPTSTLPRTVFYFNSLTTTQLKTFLNTVNYDITGCLVNCSNHGVCQMNFETLRFECICEDFYQGTACQTDIRPCSIKDQCLNDGKCKNLMSFDQNYKMLNYECECVGIYEGKRCESIKNVCQNETCSKNGYCYNYNQTAMCKCFLDYEGNKCENVTFRLKMVRQVIRLSTILAIIVICLFVLSCICMDFHHFFCEKRVRFMPKNKEKKAHQTFKFKYYN
jgi:hypothetical protein